MQQIVVEVYDVDNRLENIRDLLMLNGFINISVDLQCTSVSNMFQSFLFEINLFSGFRIWVYPIHAC